MKVAFFSCLPSRTKSAMAEILVSDLCELSPAPGGLFHSAAIGPMRRRRTISIAQNRTQARARISACFHCSAHCFLLFFLLFSIVFAPAAFLSPLQGLAL
jgi:hypothetical protein